MILTEEKRKEFVEKCEPLMKWLADNCHLHIQVIVDCGKAQLVEGVAQHVTEEFIRD
jgi:hypothetical protein